MTIRGMTSTRSRREDHDIISPGGTPELFRKGGKGHVRNNNWEDYTIFP